MANPLLAPAGSRINPDTGELLDEEERKRERAQQEEEEGPSPLAMGLLQLGASMMRDEGWRDRPITLGESLGKAIPRGIAGYYNQDALNRQYEGEANEQRMLEQAASDQAALEQATELQKIEAQNEKVRRYKAFVANVESIPDSFFGKSAETASHRKQIIIQSYEDSPEKGIAALNKIYELMDKERFKEPKAKTRQDIEAEKQDVELAKLRKYMPMLVSQVTADPDVTRNQKEEFAFVYGKADFLSPDQLRGATAKAGELISQGAKKNYEEEFQTHYEWLKKPDQWDSFPKNIKQKIEFAALNTDRKAALASLKKIVEDRQDKGDWDIISSEKVLRKGRWVTIRKEKNYSTLEERTVEIDGAFETVKRSMSGKMLMARFGKEYFGGLEFDSNTSYNLEIVNGVPQLSGNIIDLTPDKAIEYAKDMRVSAVSMGLITEKEAEVLLTMPPAEQIKTINRILIDNKDQTPGDPNTGIIKTGAEINSEAKEEKKVEWAKIGKNYYWDGRKWVDLGEDQAELVFGQEEGLRREYDKNTRKYRDSLFAYNSIVKGYNNSLDDPHSAGINDIMIVRAFLLMIEPNSVVRESEFATAARSQGLVNYSMNLLDKLKKGSILTQDSRARFRNAATAYMTAVMEGHKLQRERYTMIANAYGLSPARIIDDPFANLPELKNFEVYIMTDEERQYLKDVKLIAPEGTEGVQKKESEKGIPIFKRKE